MSGPKFFGQFLKVATEREREKVLICAANEANSECYTIKIMRLPVKVNVFSHNLILYDLDCLKCIKE